MPDRWPELPGPGLWGGAPGPAAGGDRFARRGDETRAEQGVDAQDYGQGR